MCAGCVWVFPRVHECALVYIWVCIRVCAGACECVRVYASVSGCA